MNRDAALQRIWYDKKPLWLMIVLLPLSGLFALIVFSRQLAYRCGLLATHRIGCPVIVVGNLSVGGTGKTPLVMWLAQRLSTRGHRVAIVTRGYGGSSTHWPREVSADTSPREVGDEPVMMAKRGPALVVAGPDRVAAAERAVELGATLILCDDGLQHYRLQRDAEIAVIDAARGLGNGLLLPAGPLRELSSRLKSVDMIVATRREAAVTNEVAGSGLHVTAHLQLADAVALRGGEACKLSDFHGRVVHAVAAIGNPQPFFAALRAQGLLVTAHALPDHAQLTLQDITFGDDAPVLMTEKDAVKCRAFADCRHWLVRLDLQMSDTDVMTVDRVIGGALQKFSTAT